MKILFLNPDMYVENIIDSLYRHGHEIDFLCPDHFRSSATFNLDKAKGKVFHAENDEDYRAKLSALVSSKTYDYIFPTHSDVQAITVAEALCDAEVRWLTPDVAAIVGDKEIYQRIFEQLDIPCAKIFCTVEQGKGVEEINRNKDSIVFPCIVKPTNGTGGQGVKIIDNLTQLRLFFADMRNPDRVHGAKYIVQSYIPGRIYSPIGHVCKSRVCIDMDMEIETVGYPYAIEGGWILDSNRFPREIHEKVRGYLQRFCDHVGLDNIPWGIDVVVDKDDNPYIIDFCWRLGRNSVKLLSHGNEKDYGEKLLNRLVHGTGFSLDLDKVVLYRGLDIKPGKISSISCSNKHLAEVLCLPTTEMSSAKDDLGFIKNGYAVVLGDSYGECEDKFKSIKDSIEIKYLTENS